MTTYNVLDEIFQGIDNIRNMLGNPSTSGRYHNVTKTVEEGSPVTEVHYVGLRQTAAFNIELDCGVYTHAEKTASRTTRFNFKLTLVGARKFSYSGNVNDAATKTRIHSDIESIVYEVDALVFYHPYRKEYGIKQNTNTVTFNQWQSEPAMYDESLPIHHNYIDLSRLSPVITVNGKERIVHDPISKEIILENLQPYLDELHANTKEDNTNE